MSIVARHCPLGLESGNGIILYQSQSHATCTPHNRLTGHGLSEEMEGIEGRLFSLILPWFPRGQLPMLRERSLLIPRRQKSKYVSHSGEKGLGSQVPLVEDD